MAAAPITDPLRGPPPPEVPLKNAPLLRVVAQVRFPTLLAVRSADRVSGFQDAVRHRYPYLEEERLRLLGPISVPDASSEAIVHWRFWDEQRRWRATLTQDFIALETTTYGNRDDFVARLGEILRAFQTTFEVQSVTRLGLRYINEVKPPSLERIGSMLNPEVLGAAKSFFRESHHLLTQMSIDVSPGTLLARWGKLPGGMTTDATAIEPTLEERWLIDLDLSEVNIEFDPDTLSVKVRTYSERIYTVFRWMVTNEFLREFGGEV